MERIKMSNLELEYIEATDEYNISGLKYSIEEAKQIAFFIETKEQDKSYTQQDWDRQQVEADEVSEHTQDNI
tara:strand:- start:903 stop:1118 length:216 start_codon:yes stop_codon:yes gene_type:complete